MIMGMTIAWRARFRNRFEQLKRESGLTQDQLATAVGVSQGTIAHWLNGRRTPDTLEQYEKLAAALGWHPAHLLYGITAATIIKETLSPESARLLELFNPAPPMIKALILSNLEAISAQGDLAKKQPGKEPIPLRRK